MSTDTAVRTDAGITIYVPAAALIAAELNPLTPEAPFARLPHHSPFINVHVTSMSPSELEDAGHRLIALADEARRLIDAAEGTT